MPLGAHVHRAGDVMVLLGGDAHDHRQLRRLEIAHRALDRLEAEARMLEVEQHEVAAGRLQDVADPRRRELDDEMAELRRPACRPSPSILRPPCHPPPCQTRSAVGPLLNFRCRRPLQNEIASDHRLLTHQRGAFAVELLEMRRPAVCFEGRLVVVNLVKQHPVRFPARLEDIEAPATGLVSERRVGIGDHECRNAEPAPDFNRKSTMTTKPVILRPRRSRRSGVPRIRDECAWRVPSDPDRAT